MNPFPVCAISDASNDILNVNTVSYVTCLPNCERIEKKKLLSCTSCGMQLAGRAVCQWQNHPGSKNAPVSACG